MKQTFRSKQLFRCNEHFNKTNILTKHTFWWNKLFDKTNFEKKQTLLLIYYSDYCNLKFMIDSFFVSFKNFLFPSVQVIEKHGMIVSIENVKVNTYFVITYSLILRKKVFLIILNSPRIKKNALVFSYNSTFSALQEHCWVRLCPALWTKSWIQGVKF